MLNRRTRVLVSLIAGALIASAPYSSFAQEEDDIEACENGCAAAEDSCFAACEGRDDAVVCEAGCTATADQCIEDCSG
jgi:hypothetical protein